MKEEIFKTRESIKKLLENNVLTVVFTKDDGSERTMKCTLNKNLLLPVKNEDGVKKTARKVNEDVLRVYDVEVEGWRSFRIENIKYFQFSLQTNAEYGLL